MQPWPHFSIRPTAGDYNWLQIFSIKMRVQWYIRKCPTITQSILCNLVAWLQIPRIIDYAIFCPRYDTYVEPRTVWIKRWELFSQLFTYAIMKPIFLVCNNDFLMICRTKLCQTVLEQHQGFAVWSKFGNGRSKCWSTWFKNWWSAPVFESGNEKWPRCNVLVYYCIYFQIRL